MQMKRAVVNCFLELLLDGTLTHMSTNTPLEKKWLVMIFRRPPDPDKCPFGNTVVCNYIEKSTKS